MDDDNLDDRASRLEASAHRTPPPPGRPPLETFQCIQVLQKEYDTLRAEIVSRTASGYPIKAVFQALFVFALTRVFSEDQRVSGLWMALAIVAFYMRMEGVSYLEIDRAAAQLRHLEGRINRLAGRKLLTWERYYGGAGSQLLFSFWRLMAFRWGSRRRNRTARRRPKFSPDVTPPTVPTKAPEAPNYASPPE